MWLFTTTGFFSIVNKVDHDNLNHPYQLRARSLDELTALVASVPVLAEKKIHAYDYADYAYRIFLNQHEAGVVGAYLVQSINYTNFKNQFEGKPKWYEFKKILGQIWNMMYQYQEDKEKGSRKRYHQWSFEEAQPRRHRVRKVAKVAKVTKDVPKGPLASDRYDGRV